ncbi:MAG: VCBS repeat-containing protein, partial [Acidobacteriales bacterium]|nr:VCBS repeat-containing protein [Terriglobales bacterium]
SVLLNDGRGNLISRRSFDASSGGLTAAITSIAVGYIDRDKNLDVAAVEDNSFNRVLLLPGNPDGTLRPAKTFRTGKSPRAVALADVDGDGWTDIITANGANSISVLRGNGLGNFKPHVDYTSGLDPYILVIGDFNNDGAPDVVTGNYTGRGVSALLNDGTGAFPSHIDAYIGSRVIAIAAGDFNKDGNLDIATANGDRIQGSFSVLLGNGDGTFVIHETNFKSFGSSVVIGDVNQDGNPDLVLLGNDVTVYPGQGDGRLGPPIVTNVALDGGVGAIGDFNGDGKLDAVVVTNNFSPLSALLLYGNGDGTFQPPQRYPIDENVAVAVGDFNRDGALDFAAGGDCCVSVLLNAGAK